MPHGIKLQLVPVARDKWKAGIEEFFLAKQIGYPLNWLEVPATYTYLSEVHTENLLKARDGWGSKKFMSQVPSSCDLTVEEQAGCSTCGRISGALAVIWNIAGAHSPKHENKESIG